jgi:hypothetical protein
MAIVFSTIAKIKSDPLAILGGTDRINAHFAACGHVWRHRLLDPANTLLLFILQILHGNTGITHLRHLSGLPVAKSSYCEARKRLPLVALAHLVEGLCCECIQHVQQVVTGPTPWLGRRVVLLDGTSVSTPDTPQLQKHWPQPSEQKSGCGFPVLKIMGALDLATGMILHLTMMSLKTSEFSQLAGVHACLCAGDVLLADRGFCSYVHLALLTFLPVDAVFRMHQAQIVDFTPNRPHRVKGKKKQAQRGLPRSIYVRKLGIEDQLVQWIKPIAVPKWIKASLYASLQPTLLVRELRYHIVLRGRRTRVVMIATSLLDPMRYPKRRIAELYGLRWEVETNFRHLKQTMGMDQLKCKDVQGVLKELMIFVLVYNLVRAAMAGMAARQNQADANRMSFIDALRWLAIEMTCACRERGVSQHNIMVRNHIRPGRCHPRARKRRRTEYDLLNKPRHEYAQQEESNEVTA